MVDNKEEFVAVLYPSMYFGLERLVKSNGKYMPHTTCAVNNIYLNGVRIAAVSGDEQVQFFHTDQIDSVKAVTDGDGRVVTRMEYLPYGETWFTEGDKTNRPKYNSQELDTETNFYYYNARYYDPAIARFTTADTMIDGQLDTQGWNRFTYCKNNPIIYKDPTGHLTYNVNANEGKGQFSADKGDTWQSISKETGVEVEKLMSANKDSKGKVVLAEGKNLNVPETANIKVFKQAAAKLGDKDYAVAAYKDGSFHENTNKCNKFVNDMVQATGVKFPQKTDGKVGWVETGPVNAGTLAGNDKLINTRKVPQNQAKIGDIVAFNRPDYRDASGHTAIYTGNVAIKKDGVSYKSGDGSAGTIGAGEHTVNYRTLDYLASKKDVNPQFRTIERDQFPHHQ